MIARLFRFLTVLVALAPLLAGHDLAAREFSLIRDAETEDIIRAYAAPIFRVAGLDSGFIRVEIINDSTLNAFVAGGQRIFINTGLILAADRPGQLISVIAHETGHITGGHLVRTREALNNARTQSIIATLMGIAAAVAGGGQAGAAIIAGGQSVVERNFLSYSRTQEAAADAAALNFLDATEQSARGMIEFFEKVEDQEALVASRQDPYLRSHPLTRDRIATVQHHVSTSPYSDRQDDPALLAAHRRVLAKLRGFLHKPQRTFAAYPASDTSVEARYARAVAYHRDARLDQAIAEIDSLLGESPSDPYFNELKGQILYESGKVADSLVPLTLAVRQLPESPLIRVALAQSLIGMENKEMNRQAIDHLESAVAREHDMAFAWYHLSVAYGREGDLGRSALASAEQYFANEDFKRALGQAQRAQQKLPEGTPGWLRAQDIERLARQIMDERR